MTRIVGAIRDVHLTGASGTLTIWSGFRPITTAVIAPKRREWEIKNGVMPEGVVVSPGPAVVQLDVGVGAFKSWPVEVPDQPEITIQELLFQTLPWSPDTVLPPPGEVTDLLRLIADTTTQYQTALWEDTNLALTRIYESMTEAQGFVVAGRGYATEAERFVAAALQHALDALGHARTAESLAGDAGGSAEDTAALRDEAAVLAAQIEALNRQINEKAGEVAGGVVDSEAARAAAEAAAALAAELAEQARAVRAQIDRHLQDAQAAVAEGERQVQWAMERAQEAQTAANAALEHSGEAASIVEGVGEVLASAEEARDTAQGALSTIQGIGTAVDQIQTQVLNLHGEVLTRHGEVLTAHGEAILAASNAAASAGEAASLATDTAIHASNAAAEALEATQANAAAQQVFSDQQEQFNEDYAERVLMQSLMLEAVREAQAAAQFERWHVLTGYLDRSSSDDYALIREGITSVSVLARGTWVGRMIVQAGWLSDSGTGVDTQEFRIPTPAGSREVGFSRPNSSGGRTWVRVDYSVDPGVQTVRNRNLGSDTAGSGGWANMKELTGHRFVVPENTEQYAIEFTVGWNNANFLDRFSHEIAVNGTMIERFSKFNIGPLFGNAYRSRTVVATNVNLNAGDVVTFRALTSDGATAIRDSSTRIAYVQH